MEEVGGVREWRGAGSEAQKCEAEGGRGSESLL